MVMTLNLDYWETLSLNAGCNLYTSKFRLCVLTVRLVHEQQKQLTDAKGNTTTSAPKEANNIGLKESTSIMYFRERDKPLVPVEAFLATSVPKLLIGGLIIFLNVMAIISLIRSNRWISARARGCYVLPQTTQGLLHSLFVSYMALGILTVYSQISLSTFLLGDYRIVDEQDKECLVVNSIMLGLSLAIALHLVSLAVDRTLASYLTFQKYSARSRGTGPLWLLSIWLPSIMMAALPLSGWKTGFRFCIFLHQFNDDYLRFVGWFWFATVLAMPVLYIVFLIFLRPDREEVVLYRWHRKLQSHHRLTFFLVLAVNILCWGPFQAFLLLVCQSCPYNQLANGGEMLEYLFLLALLPSIIIPLIFSVRSSFVEKCLQRLAHCVMFGGEGYGAYAGHGFETKNPLSQTTKSPLFFIDEYVASTTGSGGSTSSNGRGEKGGRRGRGHSTTASHGSSYNGGTLRTTGTPPHFFVPHYLPKSNNDGTKQGPPSHSSRETKGVNCSNLKSSFKNKYETYYSTIAEPKNSVTNNDKRKLKNLSAYLNPGVTGDNGEEHVYDSLDSDSKYGFPILPPLPTNVHGTKDKNKSRNRPR